LNGSETRSVTLRKYKFQVSEKNVQENILAKSKGKTLLLI